MANFASAAANYDRNGHYLRVIAGGSSSSFDSQPGRTFPSQKTNSDRAPGEVESALGQRQLGRRRRQREPIRWLRRSLFAVPVVVLLAAAGTAVAGDGKPSHVEVVAEFADAGAILKGNDVRVDGVHAGIVDRVNWWTTRRT